MKILNIGSLNIDYIYSVEHIVSPGETIMSNFREIKSGGKGLNQSVAVAKAGGNVYHAGIIGSDGKVLLDVLNKNNVNIDYIVTKENVVSGHAIIQVDKYGQNSIIVDGGSNSEITTKFIDEVLENFEEKDILLLQNEIPFINYAIEKGKEKGMTVILNPSPFNQKILELPLELVDYFFVNEIEANQILGGEKLSHDTLISTLKSKYKNAAFILTLGSNGAYYFDSDTVEFCKAFPVKAIDTTAAGDTFTGYFVAGLINGESIDHILLKSSLASSLTVKQKGAAESIPLLEEVEKNLKKKFTYEKL